MSTPFVSPRVLSSIFAALLLLGLCAPAQAEVFFWRDPVFKIGFVFPDDWRVQTNGDPDVRIEILAPQGQDFATCRIRAKDDGRFSMYPDIYNQRVNSVVFDVAGLYQHWVDYDNVRMIHRSDYAALGKASAVYAEATYTRDIPVRGLPMRSFVLATLYGHLNVMFECEAAAVNWGYWVPQFMNMARTVDFPLNQHNTLNGWYRRYQDDGYIVMPSDNARTGTVTY